MSHLHRITCIVLDKKPVFLSLVELEKVIEEQFLLADELAMSLSPQAVPALTLLQAFYYLRNGGIANAGDAISVEFSAPALRQQVCDAATQIYLDFLGIFPPKQVLLSIDSPPQDLALLQLALDGNQSAQCDLAAFFIAKGNEAAAEYWVDKSKLNSSEKEDLLMGVASSFPASLLNEPIKENSELQAEIKIVESLVKESVDEFKMASSEIDPVVGETEAATVEVQIIEKVMETGFVITETEAVIAEADVVVAEAEKVQIMEKVIETEASVNVVDLETYSFSRPAIISSQKDLLPSNSPSGAELVVAESKLEKVIVLETVFEADLAPAKVVDEYVAEVVVLETIEQPTAEAPIFNEERSYYNTSRPGIFSSNSRLCSRMRSS
jgi:hypothetical protein